MAIYWLAETDDSTADLEAPTVSDLDPIAPSSDPQLTLFSLTS